MARSTSSTFRQAVFSQETDEIFLILIEIYHADMTPDTLRFVNDYTNKTSAVSGSSETYIAFPFNIQIPSDMEESLPRVQLSIDNVDRTIMEAIRTLTSAPTITIYIVLASDPDTAEAGPFELTLRNVDYDQNYITGDLQPEDTLNEPWPGIFFTPSNFPGLF